MESYLYTCKYCGKQYKPNRRKKQKYCTNSCRVRAFVLKNEKRLNLPTKEFQEPKPIQVEKMSIAGVGNAAVGTLAVNLATSLFTSEENKPATKKDLKNLALSLKQRYHPILNMDLRLDGAKPFYDSETKHFIYIKTF